VAILRLETLQKLTERENSKIVVPYESVGLMGAVQSLKEMFAPEYAEE
jgi:hypothetical protein